MGKKTSEGTFSRVPSAGDIFLIGALMAAAGLIFLLSGGRKRW